MYTSVPLWVFMPYMYVYILISYTYAHVLDTHAMYIHCIHMKLADDDSEIGHLIQHVYTSFILCIYSVLMHSPMYDGRPCFNILVEDVCVSV